MGANVCAQQDSTQMHDVVVTGTRQATTTRSLPMTVSVVDGLKLNETHRQSVLPTLSEQVPGLFVTQRGMMGFGVSGGAAGGINMRGITSGTGQVLVVIDGMPQYQGVFGHSIADAYQTMMADKVEVVRGPASVLYGSNAMGGVINIITKEAKHDGNRAHFNFGAGSWGTVQFDAMDQFCRDGISVTLGGQYGRSDNHRPGMGFEQYGTYAKLKADLGKKWSAFADFDLTGFNASQPGTESAPMIEAEQWIMRGALMAGVENHSACQSSRLSGYYNFGDHKINDGYKVGGTPQTDFFRSSDALAGASWYQNLHLFHGSTITWGADYQHIFGHAYYANRESLALVTTPQRLMQSADEQMDEVAGYVDVRQDFTAWLTLDAGVRYDYHSVVGGEWIPQAGLVIRPLASATVKGMVSKGFRNPTVKEMYLYKSANTELLPERLWNYELAWSHTLCDGRLGYGLNLFMMKGDNMIQTLTIDGTPMNINTGEVDNKGVELEANWRINGHWSANTNHSYLYMKNHLLASPEYKGFYGLNMHYGKWTANVGVQHVAGLYTEVNTDPAKEKKESFVLLNASLAYRPVNMLQLWVKGDNLLAQRYEIMAGYPMPRATFMAGVSVNL